MPKQITLQFVTRTLARLKHVTKLGPHALAYALVKNYQARPSQLEHLALFLLETAARMRQLTEGKHRSSIRTGGPHQLDPVVAINQTDWSSSIRTGGRHQSVRAQIG
jgi:hypothetical protein